jgi:hypothetical protein
MSDALDAAVHHDLIETIIAIGRAPMATEIASRVGAAVDEVEASLHRLHDGHGLVLHPDSARVWVIHPFALWPTTYRVNTSAMSWWGNCAWCSLGIAAIVGGNVSITTTIGAESQQVTIDARDGELIDSDLVVHFTRPIRRAWENVLYYCGTVLVFRAEPDVDAWCERHGIERGEVVPLRQVWELARVWYGNHRARDWKKWTLAQAQEIFTRVGLTGDFWRILQTGERF